MAYKINIDIGGMCLFVAQPSTAVGVPDRMHVLMPSTPPGGEHANHRHLPVLAFDAAYQADSKLELSTGMQVHILLRELVVKINGSDAGLKICPDIADLTPITSTLKPDVLGKDSQSLTTSRITLEDGQMAGLFPGVCWEWQGQVKRLAHIVRWLIDVPSDPPFELELRNLRSDTLAFKIPLRPKPGATDLIKLNIFHVPPGDLPLEPGEPEQPAYNAPAPHFEPYYTLFDPPPPVRVPLFRSVEGCKPLGGSGCTKIQEAGGSPYTCMVAGVTL